MESATTESFSALSAWSLSMAIGRGTPPTTKLGWGFLPPKMVWILVTWDCQSMHSR